MKHAGAIAPVLFVLLVSTSASATPEARRAALDAFTAAKAAFASHDYREAALRFDEADHLAPEPRARFDAAVAWDRAGELGQAADRYASALPALTGRERETASSRLEALEKKLAVVHVDGRADLRVDIGDAVDLALPVAIHLAAGSYELHAHGGATETTRRVEVRAGQSVSIHYDEAQPAAPATPTVLAPMIGPPASTPPSSVGAREREPTRRPLVLPIVALGTAAGFTAAGAILGILGLHARDELVASGRTDADAHDRAVTLRAASFVGFGAAAACAAVSLWLFLRPPPAQRKSQTWSVPSVERRETALTGHIAEPVTLAPRVSDHPAVE